MWLTSRCAFSLALVGMPALVASTGCEKSALRAGATPDLAAPPLGDLSTWDPHDLALPAPDLASAFDMSGFCGDRNSARIELNGMLARSPFVSAILLPLNCCDAAVFKFVSMQIATPISVMWRHQVGLGPNPPVTLDLANLPAGWSVAVQSGCAVTDPNCQPTDRYDAGYTGTLAIAGNPGGYDMSICLDVTEPPGAPHPVIHTLNLWSPTVHAQ